MVYLDFRSLCLIIACAARRPAPSPGQLQIYALSDRRMPGGNRGRAERGGGAGGGSLYAGCHTSGDWRWRWGGGGKVCGGRVTETLDFKL